MPQGQKGLRSLYGHLSDATISARRRRRRLQNCTSVRSLVSVTASVLTSGLRRREKRHLALIELGYVQDMDGANKLAEKL